jgi:hypothetical protein
VCNGQVKHFVKLRSQLSSLDSISRTRKNPLNWLWEVQQFANDIFVLVRFNVLEQRFSDWGMLTPQGTQGICSGILNVIKISPFLSFLLSKINFRVHFDWGVRKKGSTFIWGYAKGLNFDLVHQCQKVQNHCHRTLYKE